jgi:hypothetical protein
MKQFFLLAVFSLALLLFGLSSCGIMKKTKTITITETVIKIDTIIKIKVDTVPIVKTAYIIDTVRFENNYVRAKSYINLQTQKITLELTGKNFGVPIKINSSVTEKVKLVKKDVRPSWVIYPIGLIALMIAIFYLTNFNKTYHG